MGITEGNEDSGGGSVVIPPVQTIKNHITTLQAVASINQWNDFSGFTNVNSESNGTYLELLEDGITVKCNKEGLYHFGGCVHIQNNSAGIFSSLTILTRLFKNGSTETRCSQRGKTVDFAAGGEDVLSYTGTDYLLAGDEITLQYYTDESTLEFFSNSNFENPIAATLWMIYTGEF